MPAYKNKENGSWYVSAYYKNWKGEQTRKVKRGFATKRDALEWERNFLSQHSDNLDMSFENFVKIYKNDMKERLKLNTWTGKISIIEQKIMPYFREKKMNEIKPTDVRLWQNEMITNYLILHLKDTMLNKQGLIEKLMIISTRSYQVHRKGHFTKSLFKSETAII